MDREDSDAYSSSSASEEEVLTVDDLSDEYMLCLNKETTISDAQADYQDNFSTLNDLDQSVFDDGFYRTKIQFYKDCEKGEVFKKTKLYSSSLAIIINLIEWKRLHLWRSFRLFEECKIH